MTKLKNFDDIFVGDPSEIEKNLSALLPEARAREDQSIYLQILSQIALAQAMQQKFDQAHETLDQAEAGLTPDYDLARVRILLERGRVYHQSRNVEAALPLFKQSYELSKKSNFDFHTINAAHMIPLVTQNIDEKIQWNERAIDLASKTQDTRAKAWLGALHNNLAQNYIEAHRYNEALEAFKQCLKFGDDRGDAIIIRGAKWGMARALRSLSNLDEALSMQLSLLDEYENIAKKGEFPLELLVVGRGMVYEELTEIHLAFMKKFANLAYHDLSQNEWFVKLEPDRLEKMKVLRDEVTLESYITNPSLI